MEKVTLKNKPGLPRLAALMLVAILSSFGTKAFAYDFSAKNEDGVTLYYNLINGGKEAEVINSYSYTGYEGNISIPETVKNGIGYMKVTSIGNLAFSGYAKLTSVTIGKNVTSIGVNAFAESTGLTSVSIPNSVTTIDNAAFAGCSSLTTFTIPGSVTNIGTYEFHLCTSLETVTFSDGVTSIGDCTFY